MAIPAALYARVNPSLSESQLQKATASYQLTPTTGWVEPLKFGSVQNDGSVIVLVVFQLQPLVVQKVSEL